MKTRFSGSRCDSALSGCRPWTPTAAAHDLVKRNFAPAPSRCPQTFRGASENFPHTQDSVAQKDGLEPADLRDDMTYSSVDGASVFTQPLCLNTFRNGVFIDNKPAATGLLSDGNVT
jgi:hypothetical protein